MPYTFASFTGQAIPSGLHVRMNFETGQNEAKLLDDSSEDTYWNNGDREGSELNWLTLTDSSLSSLTGQLIQYNIGLPVL